MSSPLHRLQTYRFVVEFPSAPFPSEGAAAAIGGCAARTPAIPPPL
jgi:hypothetical protein